MTDKILEVRGLTKTYGGEKKPAQQRICIRQLLHDARILPPGKIFHALAFQPAAQGRVRAAYRNVKYHLTFSFPPAARLDFCAGLEYDK